jgi:hypothetical protein
MSKNLSESFPVDAEKLEDALVRVREKTAALKAKAANESRAALEAAAHEARVLERWVGLQKDLATARTRLAVAERHFAEITESSYAEKLAAEIGGAAVHGNAFYDVRLVEVLLVKDYGAIMLAAAKRETTENVENLLRELVKSDGEILRRHGFIE